MRHIKIQHPEWLEHSNPQSSIDLFRKGLLPESIAGWMIVTGLKHPLRAVYGSDLRAALALLWCIISEPLRRLMVSIRYRKKIEGWEREWAAQDEVDSSRRAATQGKN